MDLTERKDRFVPIELEAKTIALRQATAPQFVSLPDLKADTEQAFLLGRKYKPYAGRVRVAYDAGSQFQWYGDLRGNITEAVYIASLLVAVEQGYKDGGENGLPAPRLDFVPKLTDPTRSTTPTLMDFITAVYVRGFEIGRSSFEAIGLSTSGSGGGTGMMSADGNWGTWFLGTLAISAVVAAGAVLVRKSQEKKS